MCFKPVAAAVTLTLHYRIYEHGGGEEMTIGVAASRRAAWFFALFFIWPACFAVGETCAEPDQLKVDSVDRPFVQERFLAGMPDPLMSEGRLKVTAGKISWHMIKPFDVETVVTPEAITQSISGGPAQPTGPEGSDLSASIARLFAALLQGNWSDLHMVFNVSKGKSAPGAPWSVSLAPIDPQMLKILGNIEVTGCQDISRIEIDHQNGDREIIKFENGSGPAP
jgi:hypothetical protein